MGNFFDYLVAFVVALLVIGTVIFVASGTDSIEELLRADAPAAKEHTRQELESMCVGGNEKACEIYRVRFEQKCIL